MNLTYTDSKFYVSASEEDMSIFSRVYNRLALVHRDNRNFRYIVNYDTLFALQRAVAKVQRQWGYPVVQGEEDGWVYLMIRGYGVRAR